MDSSVKKVSSPIATGGGGNEYERRVCAYYLAMTLLRAVPRGREVGVAQEVRFQRLFEGDLLDDIVIYTDAPAGQARLALQIKRDFAFGEKDQNFNEVMRACWETYKSPRFNSRSDLFGLVIALYSKKIDEYYLNVLAWARDSTNAQDFFSRISAKRLSHKTQRSFVSLIRSRLNSYRSEETSDDELWGFLRSIVILDLDFHKENSRDYSYTIEVLKRLLPPDNHKDAPRLFHQLTHYAAEGLINAGSFDAASLTERLQTDGFPIQSPADCRNDLARLNEHAKFILMDIRSDIGGLKLNRIPVITEAQELMSETTLLEIVGPPGAGKSVVLKALVEKQQCKGPALVLAADRLEGKGWDSFAQRLHLTRPLREILLAMSGSDQPCIFLDGADRVVDADTRRIVNDLLRTLDDVPLNQDGSRRWTVVVTAREENLQDLHSWLYQGTARQLKIVRVPEVSSDEALLIAKRSPRLRPLFAVEQLDPLIKSPFMLSLLEDQRMLADSEGLPLVATEIEVSAVWWDRVVGADGVAGRARQQALLEFGKRAIQSPGHRLPNDRTPAEVIVSLEQDRILLRDPGRDVYRFGHDILEDWVFYRILNQRRDDLATYIQELSQPLGLSRAVQLLGCFILEPETSAYDWFRLLEQMERSTNLSSRWRQALLTAPIVSTRSRELLDKVESILVTDNARRLVELLVELRTVEVNPDYSLLPYVRKESIERGGFMAALMSQPVPRWRTWASLLDWLLRRLDRLPVTIRLEAAKVMEIWQRKSPPGTIHRKEISELAFAWLSQSEGSGYNDGL